MLLLAAMTLSTAAAEPKRVLILDSFGHDVAPFNAVASSFRATLTRDLGEPVDLYEAPLDLGRFPDPRTQEPFVDFLEKRFAGRRMDLVVPIGAPAAQFVAQHRERLFPETPIVFTAVDPRLLKPEFLNSNVAVVSYRVDLPGIVEDMLRVQPDTTNVAVVFGVSPLENFWVKECRREFQSFTNRVQFTWLDDLSLVQMRTKVATLPPHSFVFYMLVTIDAAGVPYDNDEALKILHASANAPLYGYFESQLGQGIIGGRLDPDTTMGMDGALAAIRILHGERPADIGMQMVKRTDPIYDWRELRRWHIPESRLPAGSAIKFREPTSWEQYRWRIIAVFVLCLAEAALIVGLFVNRIRRREAEAVAALIAELSSKFIHLPASEVDREIEDAQRRVCECLGLDISSLWQWVPEQPDSLIMTHLYRRLPGPATPERFDAKEYFPWALQQLKAGRIVALSTNNVPAEAARDLEAWRHFGLKTVLNLPMTVGAGVPVGLVAFNDTRVDREWTDLLVQRLQLVAQVFANALARKRADQALRESEERMTLAAKATGVGVWMWNVRSNEVWGSERWLVLFGFAPDTTVTFEKVIQRIHPDDRKMVEDGVRGALADRSDYLGDFRVVLPDGTRRWIVARGRMYQDLHGKSARMLGTAIDITYRKQTELALAESELRYRTLFETAPEGIALIGTDGYVRAANTAQARLYGYESPQQLEGLYAPLCVAEKDREQATQTMKDLLNGEERSPRHYTAVRHDGSEFIVEVTSAILRGLGREIQGYLCLTRDITASKQMEEALKESEQRFRQVAETVADFIWEVDVHGLYTYASPSVEKIMGYTPSELVGKKHFYDLFKPSVREELKAAAFQVFADRQSFRDFPNPNVSKSGKTVHLETSGVPMLDSAGNLTGYRGADSDVTERKRVEEAMQESETRFRTVANTAPVLIWMSSTDKFCTFFNQPWLDFTGRTLEQELGNGWTAGVHADDLAACLKIYNESFDARLPFTMEYRLRRHDGQYRWIADHGVPRYDSQRNFLGYIGSCADVTERRQAEAEAQQRRAELAHVARVSTVGALAGTLAHELNQPLNAILNNAQAGSRFLAGKTPDLAEVRGALDDIAQDTKRAGEVIRQIRAFVKKDEPKFQSLDLNRVIEEVVRLLHGDSQIRKVGVALELAPDLPPARGDSVQIQQVVLNLLLNAFDAMKDVPEGGRTVLLRTRQPEAASLQIEVRDRGTGVSPERLMNLFEPFHSSKREGLGLGLSISHSIIEAHRGRLWAENNPDRGATFYFTLPVHKQNQD